MRSRAPCSESLKEQSGACPGPPGARACLFLSGSHHQAGGGGPSWSSARGAQGSAGPCQQAAELLASYPSPAGVPHPLVSSDCLLASYVHPDLTLPSSPHPPGPTPPLSLRTHSRPSRGAGPQRPLLTPASGPISPAWAQVLAVAAQGNRVSSEFQFTQKTHNTRVCSSTKEQPRTGNPHTPRPVTSAGRNGHSPPSGARRRGTQRWEPA